MAQNVGWWWIKFGQLFKFYLFHHLKISEFFSPSRLLENQVSARRVNYSRATFELACFLSFFLYYTSRKQPTKSLANLNLYQSFQITRTSVPRRKRVIILRKFSHSDAKIQILFGFT